jgi:HAE1 family hydrophobic/amphiphilic exporter-1
VRTAVAGAEAGRILLDGRSTPIWVRLAATDRGDPDALRSVPLGASGGRPILLGDLAGLRFATGPAAIERVNGMRMMSVTADLAPGYALGNVTAEVDRRLDGALPDGITYTFGGESGVMAENIPHFVLAVALAVVLLYLVTAALFNSLVYPLIMMLTLPMALIGGLAALVIYGETLSLVSMIGVIMLIGLMGRNAILLIDYTNTLRLRGLRRADALREAGVARLRPIAMTTLATVFGMLPVAMRMGRASELRAPMAIVVIGGLLVSTVLTLIVIPVAYDLADRLLGRHDRVVRPRG